MNTIQLENTYQLPTYEKFPVVITHGKGAYVFDDKGNKYLDFYGGHAVVLTGHSHPKIVNAVSTQMKKIIFYSNVVYSKERARAAQKLVTLAGKPFSSVFFCNSGTEANETALKLAKKHTGKDEVISFEGSFHGRTIGALSVCGGQKYKKHVGSLVPGVQFAEFGNIDSVKKFISQKTAAIILEPIQSVAGVNMASANFYIQLTKLAKEKGIVLIFDEVQTGLGRTGKMFFGEHFGIKPDLIVLAKGLASGLPAGAVLVTKKIASVVELGDQGCTFGGGPVICAAIIATLNVITKEGLVHNAAMLSTKLKKQMIRATHVVDVSGRGLLLGITLDIPAKEIKMKLFERHILTGTSDNPNVLRIMPPLIISEKEVALFLKNFIEVLEGKI